VYNRIRNNAESLVEDTDPDCPPKILSNPATNQT